MAQVMDPHASFAYLIDNLPAWTASIDEVAAHAAQKHTDFVAEYTRLVQQVRPKRKRSPSLASIHTHGDGDAAPPSTEHTSLADGGPPPPPDRVDVDPLDLGNRYLYAQAKRKRKPCSSVRSGASGPQKFRTRNQVIVYYDGHLQAQLDAMVKSVGVARNNLRKGKNALAALRGFHLPSLTSRTGQTYSAIDGLKKPGAGACTTGSLSSRRPADTAMPPGPPEEMSFLQADKELEQVQSLCETAAHQFLRDGDCKAELDTIRAKFDALLSQARLVVESLKTLQEKAQADDADVAPTESDLAGRDRGSTPSGLPALEGFHTPKVGASIDPFPLIRTTLEDMKSRGAFFSAPAASPRDSPAGLATDKIEVDDESDASSLNIDISQYRLTPPTRAVV